MSKFILQKAYQDNDELRKSFNELAKETFSLDFEDWYQNGYWSDRYIPYSMVKDGEVIANVSVNRMTFEQHGRKVKLLQLGTVMTRREYRGQGLSRRLMEQIFQDFEDQAEGIYLYANDSVLDFYPKFGFRKTMEYQYSRFGNREGEKSVIPVVMEEKKDWDKLGRIIEKSVSISSLEMKDNSYLYLFYVSKYMRENVFYILDQNAYVIAELENETLLLHNVFSEKPVSLKAVIAAFGPVDRIVLGFIPAEPPDGYMVTQFLQKGTTLFTRGRFFEEGGLDGSCFPTLSHA